jgi:hypothetical protein
VVGRDVLGLRPGNRCLALRDRHSQSAGGRDRVLEEVSYGNLCNSLTRFSRKCSILWGPWLALAVRGVVCRLLPRPLPPSTSGRAPNPDMGHMGHVF